jgi:hypothetical protein
LVRGFQIAGIGFGAADDSLIFFTHWITHSQKKVNLRNNKMSVLLCLANRKCSVVASDGIAGVDGVTVSLSFNKTFEFDNQKLIGGITGLLNIDGKTAIEQIGNAAGTGLPFSNIKLRIKKELETKLNNHIEKYPETGYILDIILISKKEKKKGIQNNASLQFYSNGKLTNGSIKEECFRTLACGDGKATEAIRHSLIELEKNNKIESFDPISLVEEAKRILKISIDAGHPRTGGGPFIRCYPAIIK